MSKPSSSTTQVLFPWLIGQCSLQESFEAEICMQKVYCGTFLGSTPMEVWRQQGWAEGEAELWCGCSEGLTHLMRSSEAGMDFSIVSNWERVPATSLKPTLTSQSHNMLVLTRGHDLEQGSSPNWAISREGTPPPEPLANNILINLENVPWAELGATAASTHQALRDQCSWPVEDFIMTSEF